MMTQSVGVPLIAKWRSLISRSRSGSLSESECETPDWSAFRRHDPDVVGKLARDFLASLEARRVDAVVIGDENAHYARSIFVMPPI